MVSSLVTVHQLISCQLTNHKLTGNNNVKYQREDRLYSATISCRYRNLL